MRKKIKGFENLWNNYIKPRLTIATPNFSIGVAAKTKNPQSAQTTSNILTSLTGGNNLSLTDMHGNELRLGIM